MPKADLALIPQPQRLRHRPGWFALPDAGSIGIADGSLYPVAATARRLFPAYKVHLAAPGTEDQVILKLDLDRPAEGYALKIQPCCVEISASGPVGARHAIHTLFQIDRQSPDGHLPCLEIVDEPAFARRGVLLDVSRGRVPKLSRLLELVQTLALYKINELQLYVEHAFRFRKHPLIGRGVSPLSAEDLLKLDQHCAEHGIELIPCLASFGHMSKILTLEPYRHLAEDWGEGRYEATDAPSAPGTRGWTLTPAREESYQFLEDLYGEYLPLFRSPRFNVCCDEVWDLGWGQSRRLCERAGLEAVYADHVLKLRDLAGRHGKGICLFGDMLQTHPEAARRLPEDVTVLDWGYDYNTPFKKLRLFTDLGLRTYACPGTGSWNALYPRVPEAMLNIHGYAKAGKKHGAEGLLVTDWGDGGHYNLTELSWHGYLLGAEQAWNPRGDRHSFTERFCKAFLRIDEPDFIESIKRLGGQAQYRVRPNHSLWKDVFFASPHSILFSQAAWDGWAVEEGRVRKQRLTVDARLGFEAAERLETLQRHISRWSRRDGVDPMGILPTLLFATGTMVHAARKLGALGVGAAEDRTGVLALAREMESLKRRFEELWRARNRPSEIRLTLNAYREAIDGLRSR